MASSVSASLTGGSGTSPPLSATDDDVQMADTPPGNRSTPISAGATRFFSMLKKKQHTDSDSGVIDNTDNQKNKKRARVEDGLNTGLSVDEDANATDDDRKSTPSSLSSSNSTVVATHTQRESSPSAAPVASASGAVESSRANSSINIHAIDVASSATDVTTASSSKSASQQSAHVASRSVANDDVRGRATGSVIPSDYVPLYVGHQTLKDAGVIDTRQDALFIQLRVSTLFPDSPLSVDYLQYSYSASSKVKLAASLLGDKERLGIIAPTIPAYLIRKSAATDDPPGAREQVWITELIHQWNTHGKIITDPDADTALKITACERLAKHLDNAKGNSNDDGNKCPAKPLFDGHFVSQWEDLLVQPSQIVKSYPQKPTVDPISARDQYHTYQLALYACTPLVAYIIACTLHAYTVVKDVDPKVTEQVASLLSPKAVAAQKSSTDSTDDDEEWQTQTHRNKRQQNPKQRLKDVHTKIRNIVKSNGYQAALPHYQLITHAPLLALAMKITTRAMRYKYISVVIDNWQSIGCDINQLAKDRNFIALQELKAEFRPPHARWSVTQRIGNASASLMIREDHKDLVANLNRYIGQSLPRQPPALRVGITVARRNKNGKGVDHSTCTKVYLTPPTKVLAPQEERRISEARGASSASQPLPENSYAARLAEGLRRKAASTGLPHRAREQPAASPLSTALTPTPVLTNVHQTISTLLPPTQASPPQSSALSRLWPTALTQARHSQEIADGLSTQSAPLNASSIEDRLLEVQSRIEQEMETKIASMIEDRMQTLMQSMNGMMDRIMQQMMAKFMDSMQRMMGQLSAFSQQSSPLEAAIPPQDNAASGVGLLPVPTPTSRAAQPSRRARKPPSHTPPPGHDANIMLGAPSLTDANNQIANAPAGAAVNASVLPNGCTPQ